jgi:hypothetical protein
LRFAGAGVTAFQYMLRTCLMKRMKNTGLTFERTCISLCLLELGYSDIPSIKFQNTNTTGDYGCTENLCISG